ncbi:serine hydrolase domain-containing protein [Vineibacter terrae]|uniref:serine hydrolase domain-containing protein n=1 Tax=Vineibacter terrae TaxID=2586908 RepID=UPI002E3094A3|nr:serine hydrolase domain-containing protein [Vineibacter terrae]HEX2891689.1 serine hydrolase domain-containing protein [Vineibacter terrae]
MLRAAFRAFCRVLLLLPLALAAPSASAQTPDAFDAAFRDWMQANGVDKGTLAVTYRGRLVLERGYGGQDPGQRVLLASLSKAITGRCIARLVSDGRLRLDGKVGDVLAPFFRQAGDPVDARLKDATVEQLLVHRAGFAAAPRDLMTAAAMDLLQTKKSPATATPADLLAATLTAPLASAPGEAFRYSNIGYLVLGVMIETITGESYERFCGREMLEAAGIQAPRLDSEWRSFSSFGGWSLSGTEYLAFLARDRLRDLPWRGLLAEPDARHAADGAPIPWPSAWYGLGQFMADITPSSRIAWHTGTWGVPPNAFGMTAMQHRDGAAWFVWYTPRPGKTATDALVERLAALPATITAWPENDLFPERGLPSPAAK